MLFPETKIEPVDLDPDHLTPIMQALLLMLYNNWVNLKTWICKKNAYISMSSFCSSISNHVLKIILKNTETKICPFFSKNKINLHQPKPCQVPNNVIKNQCWKPKQFFVFSQFSKRIYCCWVIVLISKVVVKMLGDSLISYLEFVSERELFLFIIVNSLDL